MKASDGHGAYWTKVFAEADDFENSDRKNILTFYEAQDAAKRLVRGGDNAVDNAPITVEGALTAYESDLKARGGNPYNAKHPRAHLTSVLLAKPVQLLSSDELRKWRDGLLGKIAPATTNRLCGSLCAALELAAQSDRRIQNREAWEVGLAGLPDAQTPRNAVIPDSKVRLFVAKAYARDEKLGLLADTLAVTGARPSQAIRLRVVDLRDHPTKPKLMMPKSGKGGGRNRAQKKAERYSVPITIQLAARLKAAACGRDADALLLVQSDGTPWSVNPSHDYRDDVREIVKAIELDPDVITTYALRHSSIVRMLLANVPIKLTASLHDTSASQIEANYAAFITEHADEHARAALLYHNEPSASLVADNVIALAR